MKRRFFYIIGGVIVLSLLVVGIAYAFTVGNVDGVWGTIDTYESDGVILDVVGVIDVDPGSYWDGGGDLRTRERTLVRQASVCAGDPDGSSDLSGWTGYVERTRDYLGAHSVAGCTPTELFISEYYHDAGTFIIWPYERRVIEIYNGTGGGIDMSDYWIFIYDDGSPTPSARIPLNSYLLQNGNTYILADDNYDFVTEQQTDDALDYSGDDAVALVKGYQADVEDDAECSRWASGGTSTSRWLDSWWDQTDWSGTDYDTDENLVVYGRETELVDGDWTQVRCSDTSINNQSGFGFDGNDGPITPVAGTPFYLGAFTHYNNPVYSYAYGDQNDSNNFQSVELTITVPVTCNDGTTSSEFEFDAQFFLEETANTAGECDYGETGDEPCPDRVNVVQPTDLAATFTCPDGDYTVNILGFTSEGLNGQTCDQSFNSTSVSTEYITQEFSNNSACLWAEIDAPTADVAVGKECRNFDGATGDEFYKITVTNAGPGSSRQVKIVDTLPEGVIYDKNRGWTSTLFYTGGSNTQGSCTVTGKTVTCELLTPLPDYEDDPAAKWEIDIPVTLTEGSKINIVTVTAGTTDTDLSNNTARATCDSTYACFVSFGATASEEGILLTWETSSEEENLGFNVYRAEGIEGLKERLNGDIIPSQSPGSTSGAVYTYLDPDVKFDVEYFYWLEDVDFSFVTNLYGPLSYMVIE